MSGVVVCEIDVTHVDQLNQLRWCSAGETLTNSVDEGLETAQIERVK